MTDLLNLYPIDYPFETLKTRVENKKIILNPEYQRKFKWDLDGYSRSSKFIESCLMRIPLPACYFAEKNDGRHEVIDGVQRITTLVNFMNDKFALEGLSFLKVLEGKKFSEIENYKAELENTTLRCIILRKDNKPEIINEIFARLNQGAVKLTPQEIRHAIYPGPFDSLLNKISQNQEIQKFKNKDNNENNDGRELEELVLRFFALNNDLDSYSGKLEKQLDLYMEKNKTISDDDCILMEQNFIKTLDKCVMVFGDKAFMNASVERSRKSIVFYDLLMFSFSHFKITQLIHHKDNIVNTFSELCNSNDFQSTISGGIQRKQSILKRRELWAVKLSNIGIS